VSAAKGPRSHEATGDPEAEGAARGRVAHPGGEKDVGHTSLEWVKELKGESKKHRARLF